MNLLFITLFFDPAQGAEAPAAGSSIWHLASGESLAWVVVALIMAASIGLILITTLYLAYILRRAFPSASASTAPGEADPNRPWWQRLMGLHSLSQKKDLVMEHAYDGIAELDNPTPGWFMGLFYTTVGFAVIYLLVYHVIGRGDVMEQEYTQEVAVAEKQREAYIKLVAGKINENTVTRLTDPKGIESGKALFAQYCTACHGQQAEGKIGPNLTDDYWLHGGGIKAVYHTVTEGVPEKGMISWKRQLNPLQIQQVASYVLSLQGSKPAGAKEPQGEKVTPEAQAQKMAMR